LRLSGGALLYNDDQCDFTALDPATGACLWSWDHIFALDVVPESSLAGSGAVLYVQREEPYFNSTNAGYGCSFCAPENDWLYAVNPRTGAPWWRYLMGTIQIASFFH
jgi:outer membrane protein assembly factor BamB